MSVRRVAVVSMHTSPLAQPGAGDGGGMNVYVHSLASALARAGVECDVYTRAEAEHGPDVVTVERGFRVLHVDAGPRRPMAKHDLVELVEPFAKQTGEIIRASGGVDVLHGNYWLSGAVAHKLKHELDLPLVATFHTLARVKADAGLDDDPEMRARVEHETIACADMMLASTDDERMQLASLYDADPERIEIVAPGVDHAMFAPGDRDAARAELGLGDGPVVLFVGRIQRLKGCALAVRTLAELRDENATLLIVGGPSGADGDAELTRAHAIVDELGVTERVRFLPPQRHDRLAQFYRAAACGTPVVAASVGGLRSLVDDGATGFLVEGRDPADFATPIAMLLDEPALAAEMSVNATVRSLRYSWSATAGRLRRSYDDLVARALVRCD